MMIYDKPKKHTPTMRKQSTQLKYPMQFFFDCMNMNNEKMMIYDKPKKHTPTMRKQSTQPKHPMQVNESQMTEYTSPTNQPNAPPS